MKSNRSGQTASAPSASKSSTRWLFATGANFTRISPTMPTFGFLTSRRGSASNSSMIWRHILWNRKKFRCLPVRKAMHFCLHVSCRALAAPISFSYGLVAYRQRMKISPNTAPNAAWMLIFQAFQTTILLTLLSSIIATLLGTMAAIGIHAMKKRGRAIMLGATNIPLLNADIVTGISMMLLFVRFTELGFHTVLIAHITFNIPYVILNVLPKLSQTSKYTYEAALDLGAKPIYAFYKIVWPDIRPGVFSGFLMCITMSLDDFSITYFTKGAGVNTLSTMIYTELRKGIMPQMYALSTILFLIAFALLLVMNLKSSRTQQNRDLPPKLG